MGKKAVVTIHPAFKIGDISPRLFGSFLEPIGFMVNGSMYNPKHPTADDKGFRRDFIDALRKAGLPAVRLPGGNFVSGWDWKDSIGPMEQRKTHLDLAWTQYIPNDVGHDEYLQWAERVGCEPLYTINLGTGDINDAISIVEYTNHEGGTYWSDLRKKYGHEKPYGVKVWYLGNETDGPWQIRSWGKDPHGYGVLAHEASKAMKWVDPTIETVACVSSSPFLQTYPQWDLEVLQECYETVDYISLHHYHSAPIGDLGALLGGSAMFEDYIRTEIALCDFVQTKLRTPKQMMLSFDEFGSMAEPVKELHYGRGGKPTFYEFNPDKTYVRHDPDNWDTRRMRMRGSEIINAITSASIFLTFIRHADRIKIGCMTGGLGALAATNREHVWKSASYYPYSHLIQYARGVSLLPSVDCDTYDIPGYACSDFHQYDTHEGVPFIESAAAYDETSGELNVFVINRNWEQDTTLELDVSGFKDYDFIEQIQLYTDDINAANSYEDPNIIVPSIRKVDNNEDGKVLTTVKKLSWNVFRFKKQKCM
jgi:alpha-N-arabinofuranosidase